MDEGQWHELDATRVLKKMGSSPQGISPEEASSRLRTHGTNEIKSEKKINPITIFLGQFKSTLVIILIFATFFSALIGEVIDAIAIFIIVILNAIFGFVQEYRAEKTIEALKRMTTPESIVIRNGKKLRIQSTGIVPGDVVILEQGTRVPADMRIIKTSEMKIDEAILTGESQPVTKETSPLKAAALADRKNMCYMGTVVSYGRGVGVVVSTGMNTEMGKIAHRIEETGEEETPLQKKLAAFGKKLGAIILGICAVVAVTGILRGSLLAGNPITEKLITTQIINGIALAVAAVPEGLPAVVTVTLALGLRRLARRNALMRRLPTVETLGSTTVICSDKTGTLTRNEMTIRRVWYPGRDISVTGTGYEPKGNFMVNERKIDASRDRQLSSILRTGVLCNNASLEMSDRKWSIIGDPTEGAIIVAGRKAGHQNDDLNREFPRKKEFPFTSERKMMSTVNSHKGMVVHVKGAPENVLRKCTKIMINGKARTLTTRYRKEILSMNTEFATGALRVLALAIKETRTLPGKEEQAESGLTFLGLAGMIDPPRKTVPRDIGLCKRAGIKVVMITGDHKDTAVAISKQIGIVGERPVALTGEELEKLSRKELCEKARDISVYARVNPEHKVRIVEALRSNGHVIAMTGDGVNDAPALKSADIGIAMGIKGTDVAKEASDMILRDDNFSSIVSAIKEGRGIYDNIKKFIQYLLSSNTGEVLIVFIATLIALVDPETGLILLPLQLLWINILTDGLPALALGVDPASPDIMDRKPRDPKESILTRRMTTDILIVGIVMCIGTLFLFWLNLPTGGRHAMTVAFTAIVMFEMVRVQTVRSDYKIGFLSNRVLLLAMSLSIGLQLIVVYAPFLQPIFNTTPLGVWDWVEIIMVSISVMVIMKLRSIIKRG
jgi:Ca2+-transporting ATPase